MSRLLVRRNDPQTSVSMQIVLAMIEEIQRGRLGAGDPLPSTRDLAGHLRVNRKTVVLAYEELKAQGWLRSDRRRGTFVAPGLVHSTAPIHTNVRTNSTSKPRGFIPDEPLLWPSLHDLRLDDGTPDQKLVPGKALAHAYSSAVRLAQRRGLLGYGDPRGTEELRHSVSKMLNHDRGMNTTAANICITRGSQMALYVVAQCFVARDDTVAFEELTYPPAAQAFQIAGAQIAAVGLDAEGVNLDQLESLCRRRRVRLVYLTPHHQFPTTVMLTPSRRIRLRALAQQFGFTIVEDDYDHEFHFEHQPMFPLASNDPTGQIVYIGSFSKILSPTLRVGYIAGPELLINRLARWIGVIDRQGDPITELSLVALIEAGALRSHARKVHSTMRHRRDAFAVALRNHLGDRVSFDLPAGGLAFWIRFNDDSSRLAERLAHAGLDFLSAERCKLRSSPILGARLGFAAQNERRSEIAIKMLAASLAAGQAMRATPTKP
jgi:GntR family transcriptional regulator / MocR family aminotransferase